ncbi:MAG TPA: hypothetical protein PK867_22800 [Pirellulales bacterium]|nr:hypothetical protein [Pirellulales bacterium]
MNRLAILRALSLRQALLLAAFVGLGLRASPVHAQYGSTFSYFNPRTGFGYSQSWGLGRNSYAGGFSVRTRNFGYSTYGGYAPGRTFSSSTYANPRYLYSHGYSQGRGYYQGGTVFARSPYAVGYAVPYLARPIVATPVGAAPLPTPAVGGYGYAGGGTMMGLSSGVSRRKPGETSATAGIRPLD